MAKACVSSTSGTAVRPGGCHVEGPPRRGAVPTTSDHELNDHELCARAAPTLTSGEPGKELRVLFVNPGVHQHGGAERSLVGLVTGLAGVGVISCVVVFGEGDLSALLRDRGHRVRVVPVDSVFKGASRYGGPLKLLSAAASAVPALWRVTREVRAEVDRFNPDVIHTNGMRAHLVAPFLASNGAVTVMSLRDVPQSARERRLMSLIFRRVGAVVSNSALVAEEFRLDSRNSWVIDNPVAPPTARDRLASRRLLGLPPDSFVVANLAHFHWWKGHLDLIQAFASLDNRSHLVLAGGALYGESSQHYLRYVADVARSTAARDRIHFVGVQDDVSWIYGAADVVAHCSIRPEPFGRTIIEALLTGKVVVASAAGTPGRMLRDRDTALLYSPGDIDGLARRLQEVREDRAFRERVAEHGERWAEGRFTLERHALAMKSVYDEVRRRVGAPTR